MAKSASITITRPNFEIVAIKIRGTAPYMQNKWSEKARTAIREKMEAGSLAKKGKNREARDFNRDFMAAQYLFADGTNGMPASAFRHAMIRACSIVGYKMTDAKTALFVLDDGLDESCGTPLIRFDSPNPPEVSEMMVRVGMGSPDIRIRPMWREWSATVRVKYDADRFSATDVFNLMFRAGMQVGIGEGRPFSTDGYGMGFGTFEVVEG